MTTKSSYQREERRCQRCVLVVPRPRARWPQKYAEGLAVSIERTLAAGHALVADASVSSSISSARRLREARVHLKRSGLAPTQLAAQWYLTLFAYVVDASWAACYI